MAKLVAVALDEDEYGVREAALHTSNSLLAVDIGMGAGPRATAAARP